MGVSRVALPAIGALLPSIAHAAFAQGDPIRWTGSLRSPAGVEFSTVLTAADSGPTLVMATEEEGRIVRQSARLQLSGHDIVFTFTPERPAICTLRAMPEGGYQGRCVEEDRGAAWEVSLRPPAPEMLLPVHEAAIAMSAAPASISRAAAVYVLGPSGYRRTRSGSNGFSCVIERPRPGDLWPVCFDSEGSDKILPVAMLRAQLRAAGVPDSVANDSIAAGFRTGRFRSTMRSGVAYMLSRHGLSIDARTGQRAPMTPHLMFYAPYMQGEDIAAPAPGSAEARAPGFVIVGPGAQGRGSPHAYMIVGVPEAGVSLVQP